MQNKALVAYVPALHAGYASFFKKHAPAPIYVLGRSFIDAFPRLNRDLRALAPEEAAAGLAALGFEASVIEREGVGALGAHREIVLPDEDVSRDFAERYLEAEQGTFESIFLRWDGRLPDKQKELSPDRKTTHAELDRAFIREAQMEGEKSADWWRQIGAVLVKDGTTVVAGHTRYFPSDHALDIFGTPRSSVDFGERPDLYISMHAEAEVIARAAQAGISTAGASLYTTTFPCMNCAFLIVRSGIRTLYYGAGYSNLDSEHVLKSGGVEIIFVES